MTVPSKEVNPARRVTFLPEPTFCFSCKRFVKFCKEIQSGQTANDNVGKLGWPRVAPVGAWPFHPGELSPYKQGLSYNVLL